MLRKGEKNRYSRTRCWYIHHRVCCAFVACVCVKDGGDGPCFWIFPVFFFSNFPNITVVRVYSIYFRILRKTEYYRFDFVFFPNVIMMNKDYQQRLLRTVGGLPSDGFTTPTSSPLSSVCYLCSLYSLCYLCSVLFLLVPNLKIQSILFFI